MEIVGLSPIICTLLGLDCLERVVILPFVDRPLDATVISKGYASVSCDSAAWDLISSYFTAKPLSNSWLMIRGKS